MARRQRLWRSAARRHSRATAQPSREARARDRNCGWRPDADPSRCARRARKMTTTFPDIPSAPAAPKAPKTPNPAAPAKGGARVGLANQDQLDVGDVGAGGAGLDQIAGGFEKMIRVVVSQGTRPRPRPRAWARAIVVPSAIAPAASVGPSVPSVPALRITTSRNPAISMRRPAQIPDCGRPVLVPRMVTVVSPPEITQAGAVELACRKPESPWRWRRERAPLRALRLARTSRALKCGYPSRRASAAAASTAKALLPTITLRVFWKILSPGLGVSSAEPRAACSGCHISSRSRAHRLTWNGREPWARSRSRPDRRR